MKTFDELYAEYQKAIEVQKTVIGRYRRELLEAIKKTDMSEVKRLNSILCVLYEEKSELEEHAAEIGKYILKLK